MKPMDDTELAEIKALTAAASPEPWEQGTAWLIAQVTFDETQTREVAKGAVRCCYCHLGEPLWSKPFDLYGSGPVPAHCHRHPDPLGVDRLVSNADGLIVVDGTSSGATPADIAFIARARTAVPELAAEVERLRVRDARLREQLRAQRTDLLEIRGILSPSPGVGDPAVPVPLGDRVAPAVEWLVAEAARLRAKAAEDDDGAAGNAQRPCANPNHPQRTKAVARISFPKGPYNATTACAGCLAWQVRVARAENHPILITPIGGE